MSARASAATVIVRPAASRPSPNATVAAITVDLRVFWPAHAGNREAALAALDEAHAEVRRQIAARDPEDEPSWAADTLVPPVMYPDPVDTLDDAQRDALTRHGYDPAALPAGVSGGRPRTWPGMGGILLRPHVCELDGITIDGHRGSDLDPTDPACLHCRQPRWADLD